MDHRNSSIWIERVKRERRCKSNWENKFLTPEEQENARAEEEQEQVALSQLQPRPNKHLSERDVSLLRLSNLKDEAGQIPMAEDRRRPLSVPSSQQQYLAMREDVRQQVSATRPRSHRLTQRKDLNSLLNDLGPGLWGAINPGYVHSSNNTYRASSHRVHRFDTNRGWPAEPVRKLHNLRQDEFMGHVEKCLQLGDKPFKSGGMKLAPKV